MEQQTRVRTEQGEQQTRLPAERVRTPERPRLSEAGFAARLALDGISLLDMPPRRLEELAVWIGNSAMKELLDAQAPWLEESVFQLPGPEPETAPFQIPEVQPPALIQPVGLTEPLHTGPAADPAALVV